MRTRNYHLIWLDSHPHRTQSWLEEKIRDGFDIHHLDSDHNNNEPGNLLLMEHSDHMKIHDLKPIPIRLKPKQKKEKKEEKPRGLSATERKRLRHAAVIKELYGL